MGTSIQASAVSTSARDPAQEFQALYDGEAAYVWCSLRRLGVPVRDRRDLLHDVFVVVFHGLQRAEVQPSRPWLFAIAFRVASNYLRSARHRREIIAEPPEVEDDSPGAEDLLIASRRRALAREALGALKLDQRAVFVMHEIDGVAIPEIAEVLGIPLNTAYSRLRLARRAFEGAIERIRQKRGES